MKQGKYKDGYFILIKVIIPQADITVLNLYTFNNMALNYKVLRLIKTKRKIETFIIILGNLKYLFPKLTN